MVLSTHPVIPLTATTKPVYQCINRARRKLHRSKDVTERVALRNEIGKQTAELWRMARRRG